MYIYLDGARKITSCHTYGWYYNSEEIDWITAWTWSGQSQKLLRYVWLELICFDGDLIEQFAAFSGRCSIHIAVLKERDEIVQYLATLIKQTLHIGDNVSATVQFTKCFLICLFTFWLAKKCHWFTITAWANCIALCNGREFGWDTEQNFNQKWC